MRRENAATKRCESHALIIDVGRPAENDRF